MFRKKRTINQTATINRTLDTPDENASVYERIAHAHNIEDIEAAARRRQNNR
ncbi:MAG: hypothetical protein ACPG7F_22425 [Aggregatilineales bacterium]